MPPRQIFNRELLFVSFPIHKIWCTQIQNHYSDIETKKIYFTPWSSYQIFFSLCWITKYVVDSMCPTLRKHYLASTINREDVPQMFDLRSWIWNDYILLGKFWKLKCILTYCVSNEHKEEKKNPHFSTSFQFGFVLNQVLQVSLQC
jgi:hypothetical protein